MKHKKFPLTLTASLSGLVCLLLTAGLPAVQAQQNAPATTRGANNANNTNATSGMRSDDMSRAKDTSDHPGGRRAHNADEKFLMKAHASGMREMQLSQLAVERASNPEVRSFAQMLVTEHQQMAQELQPLLSGAKMDPSMSAGGMNRPDNAMSADKGMPAAGRSDMGPAGKTPGASGSMNDSDMSGKKSPDGMHDRWSRMMSDRKQKKLMEKSGAEFDKAYINLMVDEHESAVNLFQDGADDTQAEVQSFAVKYLPKLQQHLDQAEQLDKNMK